MSGRKPLKGGAPRLLSSHGGLAGKAYRRLYDTFEGELGPFTPLQRLEAGRVVVAYLQLEASTRALMDAQQRRQHGRGRRPNLQQIERLSRRQGLSDSSFSQAFDKLKELVGRRKPPSNVRELLQGARP